MVRLRSAVTLFSLALASALFWMESDAAAQLIRGDVNCNGFVSLVDGYDLIQHLFMIGGPLCDCEEARDVDSDGAVNLSDTIYLFNHLRKAGPPPAAPYPDCGKGSGLLPCAAYPVCPLFKRGDVNCDGIVNAKDAQELSDHLFGGIPLTCDCEDARDTNDDGAVNLGDVIHLANYVKGLATIPVPGPLSAGDDPTADGLGCGAYPLAARATGAPNQVPSDLNQNGRLDLADATALLGNLFLNSPSTLPCGSGGRDHPSNVRLLDANGNGALELVDAIGVLRTMFVGDFVPSMGRNCVWIEACPQNVSCPIAP